MKGLHGLDRAPALARDAGSIPANSTMIDVVVPVYAITDFTVDMARRSLAQLKANTPGACVIVVDNGSTTDRSAIFPNDVYLRLEANQGFAGGVNHGLRATTSDPIAVGSIDVFVPPGWLEPLCKAAIENNGVASPAATRVRYGVDSGESEQPNCVYWGGLFVMTRAVYEATGGMDEENFRLRYSDTDFGVRAAKAGFWLGRVTETLVEHHDPSISTLFMPADEQDAEWERLFEIHGQFPMDAWHLGHWQ